MATEVAVFVVEQQFGVEGVDEFVGSAGRSRRGELEVVADFHLYRVVIAPVGGLEITEHSPCLLEPDCSVAVMFWAVAIELLGWVVKSATVSHNQVEGISGAARDLHIVGLVVGGDKVVEAGGVVGRAGRTEGQHVAVVVHRA